MLVMVWHLPLLKVPWLPWYESVPCWMVLDSPFIIYLVCRSLRLRIIHLLLLTFLNVIIMIHLITLILNKLNANNKYSNQPHVRSDLVFLPYALSLHPRPPYQSITDQEEKSLNYYPTSFPFFHTNRNNISSWREHVKGHSRPVQNVVMTFIEGASVTSGIVRRLRYHQCISLNWVYRNHH